MASINPGQLVKPNAVKTLARMAFILVFLHGCDADSPLMTQATEQDLRSVPAAQCSNQQATKQVFFGDLHVHTRYSFDAYAYGIRTTPEDAYRFAKGEQIAFLPINAEGQMEGKIKIGRPLDFLAITDHAEFLGESQLCSDQQSPKYTTDYCANYRAGGFQAIRMVATALAIDPPQRISPICAQGNQACLQASSIPWNKIIAAAEQANDVSTNCSFTAFVGYEYSGSPSSSNYHRNVIFRTANVPKIPVSRFEAPLDYYLWEQLDKTCRKEDGCDYLTIPHNSNLSNGKLLSPYADLDRTVANMLDYAAQRLAREPLLEVFQHKGNSECANGFPGILGEPDELCEMEQIRVIGTPGETGRVFYKDGKLSHSQPQANPTAYCKEGEIGYGGMQGNGCLSENDFYRTALLTGLKEQNAIGLNPVKFGASASTDTHMSTAGAVQEDNWRGHIYAEWNKEGRLLTEGFIPSGKDGNPGGLTGVWAEENSRDSIFNALRNRETFGTSGPRIKPRFFASWKYSAGLCDDTNMLTMAYRDGVPMGADLSAPPDDHSVPVFLATALADSADNATPLQKLQIVKGWIDADGKKHYKVFDVAGDTDSTAGVDLKTGKRFGSGHMSLCTVFKDPEFTPDLNAYYYMRAVENPSPRWSLKDCLSYSDDTRPDVCNNPRIAAAIQEQAWTSPIWYTPERAGEGRIN